MGRRKAVPPPKVIRTRQSRYDALRKDLGNDPSFAKLAYGSRLIMGHGNLWADVVFVVEQPSKEDLATNSYLSGRERPVYNQMLMALDLSRRDVYVTGLSKWTTKDRPLTTAESQRLIKYLSRELAIIKPKTVILLGRNLTKIIVPRFVMAEELGKEVQCSNQTYSIYPVFHPTTALANATARDALFGAMSRIAVTF